MKHIKIFLTGLVILIIALIPITVSLYIGSPLPAGIGYGLPIIYAIGWLSKQ